MKFWGLLPAIVLYKGGPGVGGIAKGEAVRAEAEGPCRDGVLCSRWTMSLRVLSIELKRLSTVSNRSRDSLIASLSVCRSVVMLFILVSVSCSSSSSISESAGSRVLSASSSWGGWSDDRRLIEGCLCLLRVP